MNQTNEQIAIRVSIVTIIGNIILSIFKFLAGIFGHSTAMVSDSVHSLSDVLSTIVVIIGTKMSAKKPDSGHPYGHERLECVSAIVLAIMLGATGIGIGLIAAQNIISGNYSSAVMPSVIPMIAAIVSILSKEAMYWYTRAAGKKIGSGALMADAWHHRSDALSSIGSLAGIIGARMGVLVLDSIAGLIISLFILKVSYDIFRDSISKMTDNACDEQTIELIKNLILSTEGVIEIDSIKTRKFGERIYVDVEFSTDASITLQQAHCIAQKAHDAVEKEILAVKHCMIHVNPYAVPHHPDINNNAATAKRKDNNNTI